MRKGIALDMGEVRPVKEYMEDVSAVAAEPDPVKVASRVVAHVAHRIPFAKSVTKRFEGHERRSGIFSDIGVLIGQIAGRNESLIKDHAANMISNHMRTINKSDVTVDVETSHVEFGMHNPIFVPDDYNKSSEVDR